MTERDQLITDITQLLDSIERTDMLRFVYCFIKRLIQRSKG